MQHFSNEGKIQYQTVLNFRCSLGSAFAAAASARLWAASWSLAKGVTGGGSALVFGEGGVKTWPQFLIGAFGCKSVICVVKLQELTNEVKTVSDQPDLGKLKPQHHPLQVDVSGHRARATRI